MWQIDELIKLKLGNERGKTRACVARGANINFLLELASDHSEFGSGGHSCRVIADSN